MKDMLQITRENAIKAYKNENSSGKRLLENLFGKKTFQINIIDRVKCYEDACRELGINPLTLDHFIHLPKEDRKHGFASHKLTTIIKALNEGWVPDWTDSDQLKYYIWFKSVVGSGAGFSCVGYLCDDSFTDVCSRFYFKTKDLAEYAGKQFIEEFNDYLTL